MAKKDRVGNRKSREQRKKFKTPELGRMYEVKTRQKYSKADQQMYVKLSKAGNEERAIQLARQKLEQCRREGKIKPSEMCPCTTVHELVGEIRGKIETGK